MDPRKAFQIFIRFQLQSVVEEGMLDLSKGDIEKLASGVEDDSLFYDSLREFLVEFIEDFGENYGI